LYWSRGFLKVCLLSSWLVCQHWLWSAGFLPGNAETYSTAVDQPAAADLISFFKGVSDGRYRRGMRHPQWFSPLVAALGILSLPQLP